MTLTKTDSDRPRIALLPLLAAALLGLALAGATPAAASKKQVTIFDATNQLLSAPSAKARDTALDQIASTGSRMVRVVVPWRFLVEDPAASTPPSGFNAADPHQYPQANWAGLDAAVLGITQRGMQPLLTPSSPFPNWASQSGKSGLSDPKPAAYQDFITAIGRRYSGQYRVDPGKVCPPGSLLPGTPIDPYLEPYIEFCKPEDPSPLLPDVTHWSAWNEPNQALFLKPQRKGGKPYSPTLYRSLFLAAKAGLVTAGKSTDTLLIGETAPSGGRDGVDPVEFMQGVFCLNARFKKVGKCSPISASAWAHHPYSPGVAPFRASPNPGLVNVQTIGKLISGLQKAGRAGATKGKLKIWVTEFGIQSKPDRHFGVSLKNQAGYLAIAEYKLWKLGAVKTYSQYLLRDDSLSQPSAFTTGILKHGGGAKPSASSFPMTLLVKRQGASRVLIWGHVRPATKPVKVTVSYRDKGKPKTLRKLTTNSDGYFSFGGKFSASRTWSASAKIGKKTLQGPYLPAYKF